MQLLCKPKPGFEVSEMKHTHNFGRFDDEGKQNLS